MGVMDGWQWTRNWDHLLGARRGATARRIPVEGKEKARQEGPFPPGEQNVWNCTRRHSANSLSPLGAEALTNKAAHNFSSRKNKNTPSTGVLLLLPWSVRNSAFQGSIFLQWGKHQSLMIPLWTSVYLHVCRQNKAMRNSRQHRQYYWVFF